MAQVFVRRKKKLTTESVEKGAKFLSVILKFILKFTIDLVEQLLLRSEKTFEFGCFFKSN